MNKFKTAAHRGVEQLEIEIEKFMNSIDTDEIIRIKFLEQSAKYLNVFVDSDLDKSMPSSLH
ncbi:MAG: hypothetical protein OQK32_03190 [Gammaproteobacteria bacterium]|nr:hypothetical protein [Gammaproteobacteria bacterium]MCW8923656.1 hypothetical protein [Gammaproteobacteria bacterium]